MTISTKIDFTREVELFIEKRIHEIATEEIEKARENLKNRIPELAAEIGVRLQSGLNHMNMDTVLQILIRPKYV